MPHATTPAESAISSFSHTYRRLLRSSQATSVAGTVDAIIDELDFWSEIAAMPEASSVTARINVGRFLDLVGRWRALDGTSTVEAFLRYLDALDEYGRSD